MINSKTAFPKNAINEVEEHIPEDVINSIKDREMEKIQEES